MSTCVISGTFAKYTTSVTNDDSVRVAKWGFKETSTTMIDDLFKTAYDNANVAGAVDVIAPGTKNEATISFLYDTTTNGVAAPEVAYTFEVDVAVTGDYNKLDANPNFKWVLDGTKYNTLEELVNAIEALDGNVAAADGKPANYYAPNTLPTAFYGATPDGSKTHTIGWIWLFDENDANNDWSATNQDIADTNLGNVLDDGDATALENISITIVIRANQVD